MSKPRTGPAPSRTTLSPTAQTLLPVVQRLLSQLNAEDQPRASFTLSAGLAHQRYHRSLARELSRLSRSDRLLRRALARSWRRIKPQYSDSSIASVREWR